MQAPSWKAEPALSIVWVTKTGGNGGGETKDDLNTVRTGGWIYGLRQLLRPGAALSAGAGARAQWQRLL